MNYQTSIIISTHNNIDVAGPCVESLLKDDEEPFFEIIIVDNASQDNTAEKLKGLVSGKENIRLEINKKDRGFPGANNDGVKMARGEILILLNSDTIVPKGTIKKLTQLMHDHPDWGMLGPVTNQAGNEQKIYTRSESVGDIIREGEEFCSHSKGDYFTSERLDLYCGVIRRSVFEKLGGFDERFGLGYYEDVDLSIKANQNGIKMMFAEDLFVYHSAGKTFTKMGKDKIKILMRGNKKKLQKKYSGKIKLYHMRDRNMYIMNEYILLKKQIDPSRLLDLDYKFNNRLSLANDMYPHSPLKKMLYYLQIKRICSRYYQAVRS